MSKKERRQLQVIVTNFSTHLTKRGRKESSSLSIDARRFYFLLSIIEGEEDKP